MSQEMSLVLTGTPSEAAAKLFEMLIAPALEQMEQQAPGSIRDIYAAIVSSATGFAVAHIGHDEADRVLDAIYAANKMAIKRHAAMQAADPAVTH